MLPERYDRERILPNRCFSATSATRMHRCWPYGDVRGGRFDQGGGPGDGHYVRTVVLQHPGLVSRQATRRRACSVEEPPLAAKACPYLFVDAHYEEVMLMKRLRRDAILEGTTRPWGLDLAPAIATYPFFTSIHSADVDYLSSEAIVLTFRRKIP
jgi:hypothetical protein